MEHLKTHKTGPRSSPPSTMAINYTRKQPSLEAAAVLMSHPLSESPPTTGLSSLKSLTQGLKRIVSKKEKNVKWENAKTCIPEEMPLPLTNGSRNSVPNMRKMVNLGMRRGWPDEFAEERMREADPKPSNDLSPASRAASELMTLPKTRKLGLPATDWFPTPRPSEVTEFDRAWKKLMRRSVVMQTSETVCAVRPWRLRCLDWCRFLDGLPLRAGAPELVFELVIGRVPLDLTESEVSRYMNLYRVMAIRTQSGRMVRNSFAITAGVAVHRSASSPYTPLDSSSQELGTEVHHSSNYLEVDGQDPERAMCKQEFSAGCYLVARMLQGYKLPPVFPLQHYAGLCAPITPPRASRYLSAISESQHSQDRPGSVMTPIAYQDFARMFRPFLEEAYQTSTNIWRKSSLVLTMWVPKPEPTLNGDSLDQVMAATVISGTLTETYAKVLRCYRTCNIATKGMEAWSIKPENFDENYVKLRREDDGEFIAIPPELVDQGDPVAIEHHLKKLFAGQPVKMPKLDFAKLVEVLQHQSEEVRHRGTWHFAASRGVVVGVELTPELVFAALRKHGVSYRLAELRAEGCALYREETFHPSYAFSPRDFVVGDLRDAPQWLTEREDGGNVPMLELRPKLMWKNVNKAEQVPSLITRTVARESFISTYALAGLHTLNHVPQANGVPRLKSSQSDCANTSNEQVSQDLASQSYSGMSFDPLDG